MRTVFLALLLALCIVGCDRNGESKPAPTQPPPTPTAEPQTIEQEVDALVPAGWRVEDIIASSDGDYVAVAMTGRLRDGLAADVPSVSPSWRSIVH